MSDRTSSYSVMGSLALVAAMPLAALAGPTFLVGNQNATSLTRATVDGNTVSVETVDTTTVRYITGMTLDASGNIWFCGGSDIGGALGKINPVTGATISQIPVTTNGAWGGIIGISFAPNGTLYAIRDDQYTETLGTIDTTTGVFTAIGGAEYASDIAFVGNTLYSIDQNKGLCTIDIVNGGVTDVNPSVAGNGQRGMTYYEGVMYLTKHGIETVDLNTGVQTTIGTNAELGNLQGGIVAAVPEPTTLGLLGLGSIAALRRRRSK